jgi:hypothetical protein
LNNEEIRRLTLAAALIISGLALNLLAGLVRPAKVTPAA